MALTTAQLQHLQLILPTSPLNLKRLNRNLNLILLPLLMRHLTQHRIILHRRRKSIQIVENT
jgi:hypothetical protein